MYLFNHILVILAVILSGVLLLIVLSPDFWWTIRSIVGPSNEDVCFDINNRKQHFIGIAASMEKLTAPITKELCIAWKIEVSQFGFEASVVTFSDQEKSDVCITLSNNVKITVPKENIASFRCMAPKKHASKMDVEETLAKLAVRKNVHSSIISRIVQGRTNERIFPNDEEVSLFATIRRDDTGNYIAGPRSVIVRRWWTSKKENRT